MTPERKFIEAADELYSACAEIQRALGNGGLRLGDRFDEAMAAFADASNSWADHPGKLEDAVRTRQST